MWVQSLDWEDTLAKDMITHPRILPAEGPVQSLVGELNAHKLQGMAKTKNTFWINLIET